MDSNCRGRCDAYCARHARRGNHLPLWTTSFLLYLLKHDAALFEVRAAADRPRLVAGHPTVPGLARTADRHRLHRCEHARAWLDRVHEQPRPAERGELPCHNLGKWGARWFESCLVDYCLAANWGNWAYSAGVGADPHGFRGFNVISQAHRFDPDGKYTDYWLSDRGEDIRPIVDPEQSLAQGESRWQVTTG